jgi:hypothetical protein
VNFAFSFNIKAVKQGSKDSNLRNVKYRLNNNADLLFLIVRIRFCNAAHVLDDFLELNQTMSRCDGFKLQSPFETPKLENDRLGNLETTVFGEKIIQEK